MKKFMIVKGKVIGGHRIADLGLNVPYNEEVAIPTDRASWSRDLSESIRRGNVEKAGERSTPGRTVTQNPPPSPSRKKVPPITSAPIPSESPTPPKTSQNQDDSEELRRMNRVLMDKLERMTEGQEALLKKMGEILDRPAPPAIDPKMLQRLVPQTGGVPVASTDDPYGAAEEEEVLFIPSKIRSEKTKTSDVVEVEEESRAVGSSLDAATEALAAMGKGKRKRRRKKDIEDDDE